MRQHPGQDDVQDRHSAALGRVAEVNGWRSQKNQPALPRP
jgi:hypothetical protein